MNAQDLRSEVVEQAKRTWAPSSIANVTKL